MKSRKSYCTTPGVGVGVGVGVHIYVKVFKSLYFPDHSRDLVRIGMMIDIIPKFLFSNTPAHAYDLKVKVTDLEIL